MLFQLYGSTAMTQLLGWVLVFAGLVILNEIGRRTKIGGIVIFVIIPAILTIFLLYQILRLQLVMVRAVP